MLFLFCVCQTGPALTNPPRPYYTEPKGGETMAGKTESGYLVLGMSDPERLCLVARALSSAKRVEILKLLGSNNIMNVGEVARAIDLPVSSTAMHIVTLEEAGLITCEKQPSLRGAVKLCTRQKNEVVFRLNNTSSTMQRIDSQQLPLGAYSAAEGILPPCGMASQHAPIGAYNNSRSFHLPDRLNAEILWLRGGYLEYQFSPLLLEAIDIHWLEVSFEVCSQAPADQMPWGCDVRVSVGGVPLGIRTSTCESQGRRGTFNPIWWPNVATQHGQLQTWRVDAEGTYLIRERISDVTLGDLALDASDRIAVRIEAPNPDQPGINLFGSHFGDYNQGIILEIGYSLR